jgi:glycerophosphoryl diester phosphodiesterase
MRILFTAVLLLAATRCPAVEIIAHRGASEDAPENTVAAVSLAWAQHADAVEIDVALSKDGQVVVIHDDTTRRLAGCDRAVCDQTAAELRKLDAGGWMDPRFRGERIPLLSEVLATVPPGRRLFVELKTGPEILPALRRVFAVAGDRAGRVTLIGFDRATLAKAKQAFPNTLAYWLTRRIPAGGAGPDRVRDDLIEKARESGLDGLDLQARDTIDAGFVRAASAAGLAVYVWSVDDSDVPRLSAAGVSGFTTDHPGSLRRQLALPPHAPAAGPKSGVLAAGGSESRR